MAFILMESVSPSNIALTFKMFGDKLDPLMNKLD